MATEALREVKRRTQDVQIIERAQPEVDPLIKALGVYPIIAAGQTNEKFGEKLLAWTVEPITDLLAPTRISSAHSRIQYNHPNFQSARRMDDHYWFRLAAYGVASIFTPVAWAVPIADRLLTNWRIQKSLTQKAAEKAAERASVQKAVQKNPAPASAAQKLQV